MNPRRVIVVRLVMVLALLQIRFDCTYSMSHAVLKQNTYEYRDSCECDCLSRRMSRQLVMAKEHRIGLRGPGKRRRSKHTRSYCDALLCVCYGGRLAEEIFCHDISSGAQNDIAQATEVAKKMVLDWGMSERVGPVNYANNDKKILPMELPGKEYSERTADVIDSEIKVIVDKAYARTRKLIEENREKLEESPEVH